jgi:PTH1 family peptidyl-tRNA hydrolase
MKIIIGLGNPGEKYARTRHNAGFIFLDFLRTHYSMEPFTDQKKFHADISHGFLPSKEKIILAKPLTFMNRSGAAVQNIINFYNCPLNDIIVVHDDLDIAIGKFKISHNVRAAGHNGVQDIIDAIGSQDFIRIRIGVENPEGKKMREPISGKDYVLKEFSNNEMIQLTDVCKTILTSDLDKILA